MGVIVQQKGRPTDEFRRCPFYLLWTSSMEGGRALVHPLKHQCYRSVKRRTCINTILSFALGCTICCVTEFHDLDVMRFATQQAHGLQ